MKNFGKSSEGVPALFCSAQFEKTDIIDFIQFTPVIVRFVATQLQKLKYRVAKK